MKIEDIRNIYKQNQAFQKTLPTELKGFNWAAFLLTFIWGIPHKVWITLIAIPLIWFQLPFGLNWILLLVFQLYCGIRGNDWAYSANNHKSGYEFKLSQIKWTIFAVVLNFAIPLVCLFIIFLFVQKVDFHEFVQNSYCAAVYHKLKTKPVSLVSLKSDSQIAKEFSEKFPNAKSDNNSVIFSVHGVDKSLDLYSVNFYRTSKYCSILEQNCTIQSGLLLPSELFEQSGECEFYFDDGFNITPTEQTAPRVKKGYNIFNYL